MNHQTKSRTFMNEKNAQHFCDCGGRTMRAEYGVLSIRWVSFSPFSFYFHELTNQINYTKWSSYTQNAAKVILSVYNARVLYVFSSFFHSSVHSNFAWGQIFLWMEWKWIRNCFNWRNEHKMKKKKKFLFLHPTMGWCWCTGFRHKIFSWLKALQEVCVVSK